MSDALQDSALIASRIAATHVKRLVALPLTFATSLKTLATGKMKNPYAGFDLKALPRQIVIPRNDAVQKQMTEFAEQVLHLAETGDFRALGELFRDVDAARSAFEWGDRHYSTLVEVFQHWVMQGPSEEHVVNQAAAKDRLAWIEAAHDKAPDDYALALLAAEAHHAIGWAWRGDGWADEVSDHGWQAMAAHFALAKKFLANFDLGECNSPGLAAALFGLARIEPDRPAMNRAFKAWVQLDPTCAAAYGQYAFHKLPRWNGSHFEVELLARSAVRATSDVMGNAAYAMVYMDLFETEPDITGIADCRMFESGILDLIELYPHSATVNRCLAAVTGLGFEMYEESVREPDVVAWSKLATRLTSRLVKEHLQDIDQAYWEEDTAALLAIASCYPSQIEMGACLQFQLGKPPTVMFPEDD